MRSIRSQLRIANYGLTGAVTAHHLSALIIRALASSCWIFNARAHCRFSLEDPDDEEEDPGEGAGEEEKPSGSQSLTQTAAFARAHPATNTEIRTLLDDLQVLGRSEFKQLLKW